MTTQIVTVPVENQPGTLAKVTRLLAQERINVEAVEAIGIGDVGVVRLLTSNPDRAVKTLKTKGFAPTATEVLEVSLANKPGELATLCEQLAEADINIESLFGSAPSNANTGRIFLAVDDLEAAQRIAGTIATTTGSTR